MVRRFFGDILLRWPRTPALPASWPLPRQSLAPGRNCIGLRWLRWKLTAPCGIAGAGETVNDDTPEQELPFRPRWATVFVLIGLGQLTMFLGPMPGALVSEGMRMVAPALLGWLSRAWLGRAFWIAGITASAAHAAVLIMIALADVFLGEGLGSDEIVNRLGSTILIARLIEIPWMFLYARAGARLPESTPE